MNEIIDQNKQHTHGIDIVILSLDNILLEMINLYIAAILMDW